MSNRYQVATTHGEGATVYAVIDTAQPQDEQPCVVQSWSTRTEPNARYLAEDFCQRHNAEEGA